MYTNLQKSLSQTVINHHIVDLTAFYYSVVSLNYHNTLTKIDIAMYSICDNFCGTYCNNICSDTAKSIAIFYRYDIVSRY